MVLEEGGVGTGRGGVMHHTPYRSFDDGLFSSIICLLMGTCREMNSQHSEVDEARHHGDGWKEDRYKVV